MSTITMPATAAVAAAGATSSDTSMAAYRTLELNLISAKDLKSVNLFSRMSVYAVVSLSGDPRMQQRTPPDREGGRNPTWNSSVRLPVAADPDPYGRPCFLVITLWTERLLGDRSVGEVRVPLQDLLAGAPVDGPKPMRILSYQVRRVVSGKPKGVLNFSYSLSERVGHRPPPVAGSFVPPPTAYPPQEKPNKGNEEPVMAYPVGATSSAYPPYPPPYGFQQPPPYGYPPAPPQHHQGYAYPPAPPQQHQGYAYSPAPAEYGYPPAVAQPQRNNRLGMGLGAGLLGGALGGLLIGDMISDAAAYDAGYDAGFDDNFDF